MSYDYIFTGAGCAGLSLVSRMSKDPFFDDKEILLIESSAKNQNDRTWCFWSTEEPNFESAKQKSWPELQFRSQGTHIKENISPYRYHHLTGLDFYKEIKKEICQKENITWCKDDVLDIRLDEKLSHVKTNHSIYHGKVIFNSIINLSKQSFGAPSLWQHFYGYTIKTKNEAFKAQTVTLMDFTLSKTQQHVQFGYILPFNSNEALVEFTEFSDRSLSDEQYKNEVEAYLKSLGIEDYEILEKEKGRIPMALSNFKRKEKGLINIGTAGGMTKPTTGYTFRNIQKDSDRIIEGLKGNHLNLKERSAVRFSFYDHLLLGIIKDEPQQVHRIMSRLFKRNKTQQILKFLDEQTNLLEEIRIFLSIPWAPFLKQLIKR